MHLTYPDSDTHTETTSTAKAGEVGAPDYLSLSLREAGRLWDLIDLRGAEFQRLLRLALDEGLLGELIRSAASLAPRGEFRRQSPELPIPLCEPENQSIPSPSLGQDHPHNASELLSPLSESQSVSSLSPLEDIKITPEIVAAMAQCLMDHVADPIDGIPLSSLRDAESLVMEFLQVAAAKKTVSG
jgi:hypothetical protein